MNGNAAPKARPPRVFMAQAPTVYEKTLGAYVKLDISDLDPYGEVIVIAPENMGRVDLTAIIKAAREKMTGFDPERDFIALAGAKLPMAVVLMAACDTGFCGRLKILNHGKAGWTEHVIDLDVVEEQPA